MPLRRALTAVLLPLPLAVAGLVTAGASPALADACGAGAVVATASGGDWNTAGTWVGNAVPASNALACIPSGSTVTISGPSEDVIVGQLSGDGTLAVSQGGFAVDSESDIGAFTFSGGFLGTAGHLGGLTAHAGGADVSGNVGFFANLTGAVAFHPDAGGVLDVSGFGSSRITLSGPSTLVGGGAQAAVFDQGLITTGTPSTLKVESTLAVTGNTTYPTSLDGWLVDVGVSPGVATVDVQSGALDFGSTSKTLTIGDGAGSTSFAGQLKVESGAIVTGSGTAVVVDGGPSALLLVKGTASFRTSTNGCSVTSGVVQVDGSLTCTVAVDTADPTSHLESALLGKGGTIHGDVNLYRGLFGPGVDTLSPIDASPGTLTVTGGILPGPNHVDPQSETIFTLGASTFSHLAVGGGGDFGFGLFTVNNSQTCTYPAGTTFDVVTSGQSTGDFSATPTTISTPTHNGFTGTFGGSGSAYYYRLTTTCPPAGCPTAPGPVRSLTATPGNGTLDVSWLAPASDGGSAVTGYVVTTSPATTPSTPTTTFEHLSGLTNGTTYTVTVKARNAIGDSTATTVTGTPTTPTTPGPVRSPAVTSGNGTLAVTWQAPASDGGSPVTAYVLTTSPVTRTMTEGKLSTNLSGLANGTTYTVSIKARNAVGDSPATAVTGKPATVPGAPTITGSIAPKPKGLTIGWKAPSDGGSPITSYLIACHLKKGGPDITSTTVTTSGSVTGLQNNTDYVCTVTARNALGSGPASSPAPGRPGRLPTVTIKVSTKKAKKGQRITITGVATVGDQRAARRAITLTFRKDTSKTRVTIAHATTDKNGKFHFTVTFTTKGAYQVRLPVGPAVAFNKEVLVTRAI